MLRHATKIVATIGPASSSPEILEAMIREGVSVVRLNFSHGVAQDHVERARLVREAAARVGREVAIMADLQGPILALLTAVLLKAHLNSRMSGSRSLTTPS